MHMNHKEQGEKATRIVIGELAKYNIGCAIPLTDNMPFDLILIYNGKLIKAQVKSSGVKSAGVQGAVGFSCSTSNWWKKTVTKYQDGDFDVLIGVDMRDFSVYLIEANKVVDKRYFHIRLDPAKNGQIKSCNMKDDYILSTKRIEDIFQ